MPDNKTNNMGNAADRLRSLLERVERLEEEKRLLSADIKDVKQEAKGAGFDIRIFNQMLVERRMDVADLAEQMSLAEVYRAALGMLDGTPLGEHARRRLSPHFSEPAEPAPATADQTDIEDFTKPDLSPPDPPADEEEGLAAPKLPGFTADPAAARELGKEAAMDGRSVLGNPYLAGDACRAAWDEGWCSQSGSDGMEVPEAWRRKPKKPKSAGGEGDEKGLAS